MQFAFARRKVSACCGKTVHSFNCLQTQTRGASLLVCFFISYSVFRMCSSFVCLMVDTRVNYGIGMNTFYDEMGLPGYIQCPSFQSEGHLPGLLNAFQYGRQFGLS